MARQQVRQKCAIEDCEKKKGARDVCRMHYMRLYRSGYVPFKKTRKKGEGYLTVDGYKLIHVDGRKLAEHRYIMERHLGRRLDKKEIVHHIDGNPRNNSINNLEVLSMSDHMKLHRQEEKYWLNSVFSLGVGC